MKLKGIIFSIIIFLLFSEVMCQIFLREKPKRPPYDTAEIDEYLGWKPKSNYNYIGEMTDDIGGKYDLSISTGKDGFRVYGNKNSKRIKLLFIGDSYTQSVEVSDDKTFFHIIGQKLDAEIFAVGMAGWGNLQELMFIESQINQIDPDLIVWEVCSNDIIDHMAELELECNYKVGLRRPYLNEKGEIEYQTPKRWRYTLSDYSKFFSLINQRLLSKLFDDNRLSGDGKIYEQEKEYLLYNIALSRTERIWKLIISEIKDCPLLVFNAGLIQPSSGHFRQILENLKIEYTPAPYDSLYSAKKKGETVHSFDGWHWNENGHRIIADKLAEEIENRL